jgi:hypothetical protein
MKSYANLLLLLLTSVMMCVLPACQKDQNRIVIEGTVTDQSQGMPLEGATVYLLGKLFSGGLYNPDPSIITSTTTNAQGKFVINQQQVKANEFEIHIEKELYFSFEELLSDGQVSAGKTYKPSYSLFPAGWIRLRVQNTHFPEPDDQINYRVYAQNPDCSDCCQNAFVQGNGMNYNQESVCKTYGGTSVKLLWYVHKSGISKADSATLQVPVKDTVFYHLKY